MSFLLPLCVGFVSGSFSVAGSVGDEFPREPQMLVLDNTLISAFEELQRAQRQGAPAQDIPTFQFKKQQQSTVVIEELEKEVSSNTDLEDEENYSTEEKTPYLHPSTIKRFEKVADKATPKAKRALGMIINKQQELPEHFVGRDFSDEKARPNEPETLRLGVPPELVCPLTNTLFVQPVKLPNGNIYSRKPLKEYLHENDRNDPLTGVEVPFELNVDLLPVHKETANKVRDFIASNPEKVIGSLQNHYNSILERYEQSSEVNPQNALSLGLCYVRGEGTPKNVERGMKLVRRAAEAGLPDALVELGKFNSGANDVDAFKFFKKASELGNSYGIYRMGLAYLIGQGVEKNPALALEHFTKAAEQGAAGGYWGIGVCLLNGVGREADPQKAYDSFLKAAEMGMKRAQYMVGLMLRDGDHVPQHFDDAYYWFTQSAELGHVPAMVAAGTMIMRDQVEDVPPEIAVVWFKTAAQKNDPQAFYNLSLCFLNGLGLQTDYKLARHCLKRAADLGLEEAKEGLKMLEKNIEEYEREMELEKARKGKK